MTPRTDGDLAALAGEMAGLHATDPVSVFLGARARLDGVSPGEIEDALYRDRSAIRMLAMRRTMFIVPRGDIPLFQGAAAGAVATRERARLAAMLEDAGLAGAGEGDAWIARVAPLLLEELAARDGTTAATLSTSSPVEELRQRLVLAPGKRYETTVSVASRLLLVLAAEGRVVRGRPKGTWISTQYQWELAERWLGHPVADPVPAAAARAELVRRWLVAFGPGTVKDLRWWTGFTAARIKEALAAVGAVTVELDGGGEGVILPEDLEPEPPTEPWVALLPGLDPTPMGWKERDWYLGDLGPLLFDTVGNVGHTIWCDGRIVGGWAQRADGEIVTRLLVDVGSEAASAVEAEAAALQEWLGEVRFTGRFPMPLERELTA